MKQLYTHLILFLFSPKSKRSSIHRFCICRSYATKTHHDFECQRIFPPYNRGLYDFYGNNFSSRQSKRVVPSLPGEERTNDVMYALTKHYSDQDDIVAALRLTRSKSDAAYTFVRSLCCGREYRRQGLSLRLLRASMEKFDPNSGYYCFASPDLSRLYDKAGFARITNNTTNDTASPEDYMKIPRWMANSYKVMANKWNQRGEVLHLFLKYPMPKSPTNIVLLQHCSELSKSTATGWLAHDNIFNSTIGSSLSLVVPLQERVNLHSWVWSGRNDTAMIEKQINDLSNNSSVRLLWTGNSGINEDSTIDVDEEMNSSYIILDGTWQQAQTIFRKNPILWNLPRISLSQVQQTKYTLRKDYSGWRERFSMRSDGGGDLLCTAEVVAAILDRRGDNVGADQIRYRLDVFQKNYPQIVGQQRIDSNDIA
jgi:DTW domain-containing protein YfiP